MPSRLTKKKDSEVNEKQTEILIMNGVNISYAYTDI